jgi:subtilisin family serine protease
MQNNTPHNSAPSHLRILAAGSLFLAASVLIYLSVAAPLLAATDGARAASSQSADATNWRDKVDPRVADAAAAGETEFIIYMAQQADLSAAKSLPTKEEKGTYVYRTLTALADATQAPVKAMLAQRGLTYSSFWISNAIFVRGNLDAIEAVASLPEVAAIQPVGKGSLKLPPPEASARPAGDAVTAAEPGLVLVNADDVWAMGIKGQGVVVAGADTGVRFTHEALRNQYRGWTGSAASSVHDYNWHDAIHVPNWPPEPANACNPGGPTGAGQPSPLPCDDDVILGGGHGSHTMGSMLGFDGGANQVGMAPQAKWIACRNLSNGVGAIPTYLECMQWFIAPTKIDGTAPDPTKAPHVVNNSWGCVEGCPPEPNPLRDTLQASRAAGIFYVVSAGNDGPACGTLQHPLARYPESFTVGSTTHNTDVVSGFSSRGPTAVDPQNPASPLYIKPNITAPGSGTMSGQHIRSALRANDSAYGSLQGTSMAGPHVAGLVALIISANPALAGNIDRIEDIIEQTAVRKTTTEGCGGDTPMQVPNNTYGWGRIDALAAVNLAIADANVVPLVGIASRKTHGAAGALDLSLSGFDPVVEPRVGQPTDGSHTIVFTFANPLATVSGAVIESGTGTVASSGIGTDARQYIVNLSGVANAQELRLKVSGITDTTANTTTALTVRIGFLIGDTTGNRAVNSSDVGQVKAQSGGTANSSNMRLDVTANGDINATDVSLVKSNSGNRIP